MAQTTFLPKKKFYKSKINWVFSILALTQVPEVANILGNLSEYIIPVASAFGIVFRTFFTNTVLEK